MNTLWPARSRQGVSRRAVGVGFLDRTGLLVILASLTIGVSLPTGALAEVGGAYILQCFCPLEWEEPWDGQGVFDESDSLDTVALANDGAVLLIHEILLADGDLDGMIADRTRSLERASAIANLAETWEDETVDEAFAGRTWVNAGGDTMYGFQYVQVWETDFLLSIEFIAPEDDFVEAWDDLQLVLLIGSPILGEFDAEDVAEDIVGRGR